MSRRRFVTDNEHALWAEVIRSITPLRSQARAAAAPPLKRLERGPHGAHASERPVVAPVKAAPPLTPLGKRLKQRVARGREAIDARIDLHGMTRAQAHAALLRFMHRAQADRAKIALIVTGKGTGDGMGERGVLKRQVPMWLRMPEFRPFIVGFEDAHMGHGGEGALYVRLRRAR
jgi:DNA-nicking Smr family endonuclease